VSRPDAEQAMAMKVDEYNNVCVISIGGDLAGAEPAVLRQHVEGTIDKKQLVDFVLDFERAGFIDSEGLETLLWLKRRCEDLFGQLKLANLDENVRKILEITRLQTRFHCQPDVAAALKTIR
jgi:anti-anti-sigma factor